MTNGDGAGAAMRREFFRRVDCRRAAVLAPWRARHSQRHISEVLRSVLGVSNLGVGLLYVLAYLDMSPVRI